MDNSELDQSNILKSLNIKKDSLRSLVNDLCCYEEQIASNAKHQKECIRKHFDEIKNEFVALINEKAAALMSQVDTSADDSLAKARSCREKAESGIKKIDLQIVGVNDKQLGGNTDELDTLESINPKIDSAPHQLVGTVLQLNLESRSQLKNVASSFGKVSTQSFLIISDITPKMSSIAVNWKASDGVKSDDCASYVLQMSEVGPLKDYFNVYEGSQSNFIARNLKASQEYSFRVSRFMKNVLPFWSIPKSISTQSPVLKWKADGNCALLNAGSTLSTISPSACVFVSSSKSYTCGLTLTISVVDLPDSTDISEDGFGLSTMDGDKILPMDNRSLFLTCAGVVCVGAQKMTTRLPAIRKGSMITFDSEVLSNKKVRVTIEVEEKVVTFDCPYGFSNILDKSTNNFNFYARLTSPGWVVTVE